MKIICLIKTFWFSFWSVFRTGIAMDGHDYIEQKNGDLVCEVCGQLDKYKKPSS